MSIDTGFTIEDRIKAAEEAIPVPYRDYHKLEAENAALKEENERLKAEKVQINGKLAGSRLAVSRLEARVAELEEVLECSIETTENVDGGPAFPFGQTDSMSGQLVNGWGSEGMTLRDYFAAKAMQALLPAVTEFPDEHWRVGVALDAYAMADAMFKAREVGHDSQ